MRFQFLLLPAALVAAAPAFATYFMITGEAQNILFPGATFTEHFFTLSDIQLESVESLAGSTVRDRHVKAWRVSGTSSGWFLLDQVSGKDDTITYAVALDDTGAVRGIEILECLANYAGVTLPAWRAQFRGETAGEARRIDTISGATLSSQHITDGVRRVLATYAAALK